MTTMFRFGVAGEITTDNVVNCARCCYHYGYETDKMPYINGTHFINGTDIFPGRLIPVGFAFGNDGRVILPCAINTHVDGTVFYQSSSSSTITPKIYLFVLGLVAFILVGM